MSEITIISRGEGSRTRNEFENFIETELKGTDNIALSTTEVSEILSNDTNTVGYIAYSTTKLSNSVKKNSINGIYRRKYPPQKPIFFHM